MAQPGSLSNEQLQAVLNDVWQKSLPLLKQRVEVLEKAVYAYNSGSLTPEQRREAFDEAHKMAGLLGTFGYPEGTDAARMLELTFDEREQPEARAYTSDELADAAVKLRKIVSR